MKTVNKFLIFLLFILLVPSFTCFAEEIPRKETREDSAQRKIFIGPVIGVNFSKWAGGNTIEWRSESEKILKRIPQLRVGIVGTFELNRWFSLQSELLFNQKGSKWQDIEYNDLWFEYHLNFLDIVLLPKFSFGGKRIKFFVNPGISLGYLMGGKLIYIKYQAENGQIFNLQKEEIKLSWAGEDPDETSECLSRFDMEIIVGFGLEVILAHNPLSVEFRWSRGLLNTMNNDFSDYTGYSDIIGISLSYQFRIDHNKK
jgi:hypothetical protein